MGISTDVCNCSFACHVYFNMKRKEFDFNMRMFGIWSLKLPWLFVMFLHFMKVTLLDSNKNAFQ